MPERRLKTPAVCPVCAEDVPRGALACPECGADHKSGWAEDAEAYDAVGLPEENFDYMEFVREEFGAGPKPARIKTVWWIAAIILILAFILVYLSR